MCIDNDKSFEQISFTTSLTPYAVDIRYDEFVSYSGEDVNKVVSQTKEAVNFIMNKIEG